MNSRKQICLALDTALEACSVGLSIQQDGEVNHYRRSLMLGRGHAEHLMGELASLLEEASLSYQDLTRLAVTVGPGSFTGLRVGLATARGLALALQIPLIGISTLSALALTAKKDGHEGPLAVAIDARRNQIYGQMFDLRNAGTDITNISDPDALTPESFAAHCQQQQDLAFIGNGSVLVKACCDCLSEVPVFADTCPDMSGVACWAMEQPVPDRVPSPLYLRAPDAKPQSSKAIARA